MERAAAGSRCGGVSGMLGDVWGGLGTWEGWQGIAGSMPRVDSKRAQASPPPQSPQLACWSLPHATAMHTSHCNSAAATHQPVNTPTHPPTHQLLKPHPPNNPPTFRPKLLYEALLVLNGVLACLLDSQAQQAQHGMVRVMPVRQQQQHLQRAQCSTAGGMWMQAPGSERRH